MAKKQEQSNEIVEKEAVVVNEKDIVSGDELKETDVIDVKAPEVIVEDEKAEEEAKAKAEEEAKAKAEEEAKAKSEGVKLKILVAFTDKYTKAEYAINDEVVFDKARAKELLDDPRRLVEKN